MTRADRLLILVLAVAALLAWPLLAAAGGNAEFAEISGPGGATRVPLGTDDVLLVDGTGGDLRVVVQNGSVRVEEADCPNQICVRTGRIESAGSVIACVPNDVVIRVEGGQTDGIDARIR